MVAQLTFSKIKENGKIEQMNEWASMEKVKEMIALRDSLRYTEIGVYNVSMDVWYVQR